MPSPKKPKKPLPYIEVLRRMAQAGVGHSPPINRPTGDTADLPSLQARVDKLMGIANQPQQKATDMLIFVMYDIESDKVRRLVAKYLEQKGCFRIQKSIFLGNVDRAVAGEIKSELAGVQALYDNHDSIIVCPVASDEIRAMTVIGQNIDVDIITGARNTLFF